MTNAAVTAADGALPLEMFEHEFFEEIGRRTATQERSFFERFIAGKLTPTALKTYYIHIARETVMLTQFIALNYARAEHRDQAEIIAHNFVEEWGHGERGADHPGLAVQMAKDLGATDDEVRNYQPGPVMKAAYERIRALSDASFIEGVTAMTVIEADLPIRHNLMYNALISHYGMKPEQLKFYDEHRRGEGETGHSTITDEAYNNGDDVHVSRQARIICKYAVTKAQQDAVMRAIATTFEVRGTIVRELNQMCV